MIRFIFDKMEAPRGALRHYNADELEPLSRAGLEALPMEIQDEYHLREGEDQLYVDATKPIRAFCSANAGAKVLDYRRPRRK